MYCKKCGKKINDNAKFCPYCGAKQGEVNDAKRNTNHADNIQSEADGIQRRADYTQQETDGAKSNMADEEFRPFRQKNNSVLAGTYDMVSWGILICDILILIDCFIPYAKESLYFLGNPFVTAAPKPIQCLGDFFPIIGLSLVKVIFIFKNRNKKQFSITAQFALLIMTVISCICNIGIANKIVINDITLLSGFYIMLIAQLMALSLIILYMIKNDNGFFKKK